MVAQPREGVVLSEGVQPGSTPISASTGGDVKLGRGVAGGVDVEVSPTGRVEATPKIGVGIGQVVKPVEVKVLEWNPTLK